MARGKYIVIEGGDGTGKTTQLELLDEYLRSRGIKTYVAHEPGGTPIADALRTIIKDGSLVRTAPTNVLLFTAARHEMWQHAKKELERGMYVLSSRNYLSTIAYQGMGEGLDVELITQTTETFTDKRYMQPDHTIILTLDNESKKARIAKRGALEKPDTFESRDESFQQKVNDAYLEIARANNLPIVSAAQSIEAIHQAIRRIVT